MASIDGKRISWAELIFQPCILPEPVKLFEDRVVIGRAPICAVSLRDMKHISAQHCAIEKDTDGRVYIVDLSANGTFLIGEKVGKGNRKEIFDGSLVCLAKKKANVASDVYFTLKLLPMGDRMDATLLVSPETSPSNLNQPNDAVHISDNDNISVNLEEPTTKRRRIDTVEYTVELSDANEPNTAKAESSAVAGPSTKPKGGDDAIADNLVCSICFDIIHNCVSLQPCMHCFCAGCYSDWMQRSNLCPECRVNVKQINKNHVINNVIQAYLNSHPERKRSEDDIKALDAKNKINRDMLNLKGANEHNESEDEFSSDENSDDSGRSSSSSSSDDDDVHRLNPHQRLYNPQCRMCPGFCGFQARNTRARIIPLYVCPPGQLHVLCNCCFANMPDRRQERNAALPPIACTVCQQTFCDLYFGCARIGCNGCLTRFKDVKLPDAVFNDIINGNIFETNILKAYLGKANKSWTDILKDCVERMDKNELACPDKAMNNLTAESPLCQTCAIRNFRELIYQYRAHIPKAALPADVTRREDCYWGKNCRTQKKYHHAAKFNHICEQTKF